MPQIYIAEPDVIDESLVRKTLAGSDYMPVLGDVHFSGGPHFDCDVLLIRSVATVKDDIRKYFPNLKAIVRAGAGLDNVDLEFCQAHHIAVYNAPGANADAVSEYTLGMMLYALRKLYLLDEDAVKGWDRFRFRGSSMADQTVGIMGFGHIGRQLRQRLKGFSCKAFYVYDPYLSAKDMPDEYTHLVSIEELLRSSSIVSLHLPLTPETTHLINSKNLSLVRDDTILINASRGGVVDEQAVLAEIARRNLIYIADTVENEPAVNPELLKSPNVILTPHIASLTTSSEREMVRGALVRFLQAEKTNPAPQPSR